MKKPKVLILVDWFYPAYKAGGPIKSIGNIVNLLAKNIAFTIITSNTDANKELLKGVDYDKWITKTFGRVIYCSRKNIKKTIKLEVYSDIYKSIYINSLYSYLFAIYPLLLNRFRKFPTKTILTPRGMLGKATMKIKPYKKKLFLFLAKLITLYKTISWHATSENEFQRISQIIGKDQKSVIIPNLSHFNSDNIQPISKNKEELNVVFFSRILSVKNLLFAITIIGKSNLKKITLSIYGAVEDSEYMSSCMKTAKNYGINISYKNLLLPNEVKATLSKYHLFILPTKHENYGHVITEALEAECPLLISDRTPWKSLEKQKVGYALALDNTGLWINRLTYFYNLDQTGFNAYKENIRHFLLQLNKNSSKLQASYLKLFNVI